MMRTKMNQTKAVTVLMSVLMWCIVAHPAEAGSGKLKVFILARQSNMEGHAEIGTFDYIGKDPLTASILKEMRNPDGTPRVCDKDAASGVFYRMMVDHVKKVLADPKRVCPEYDEKAGYELAGFVWLQGFNDLVDGTTYPNDQYDLESPEHYAAIDVRIEGITKADRKKLDLALEEVLSPKDREDLKGASNGGYHYFGSAKIFAQMGKAFAEALLPLQK